MRMDKGIYLSEVTLSDGATEIKVECVTSKTEQEAKQCQDTLKRATRHLSGKAKEKFKVIRVKHLKEIGERND